MLHVALGARLASGLITLTPDSSALPGSSALQTLANGIGWWGLLASLVGLVVGAATWALGSHTNNYQHASTGRRAVLVSGAACLIIGAAPPLLNFLFSLGGKA
ncbi:MAG TPA: DUF6112 family protein [Acidimicrobiales bacterium]|nr:DUF6112 family protein [Acidimicrobiales bacterium]